MQVFLPRLSCSSLDLQICASSTAMFTKRSVANSFRCFNAEYDYMRRAISTNFQSVTAAYEKGAIHTDHNTIFTAVLFLTPNAMLDSGITLFKKNKAFDQAQYQQAIEENDAICRNKQKVMKDEYHAMFDEAVRRIGVRNHTAVKIVL